MICIEKNLKDQLEREMKKIGVPFKFFEEQSELDDAKTTKWTSLMGMFSFKYCVKLTLLRNYVRSTKPCRYRMKR